ncbi:hypothetical protein BN2475_280035 [Paraburkholderia ribeironis]|uniref:Uncharacterized protein n=1 Tax=Paraburkholderia ribeironis TaxID=1247936 RepID=A0A1N7S1C6_9BURK|nr:hypothetical protein BN2475_280035 [Paraburkholderia ribeironis]
MPAGRFMQEAQDHPKQIFVFVRMTNKVNSQTNLEHLRPSLHMIAASSDCHSSSVDVKAICRKRALAQSKQASWASGRPRAGTDTWPQLSRRLNGEPGLFGARALNAILRATVGVVQAANCEVSRYSMEAG